ncbi:MAG: FIST N-terminal domain-containing protein [Bdellovibrionota bacterium]
MKLEQLHWTTQKKWSPANAKLGSDAELVLVFGETSLLKAKTLINEIQTFYPKALIFGCSTSGEIYDDRVFDDTVTSTAIHFERTQVRSASLKMSSVKNSFEAGQKLANSLDHKDLSHVLVFSVGINVNGSELVKGLSQDLPRHVTVTGGLAGDKDRFKETFVISQKEISNEMIAVVGFYGTHIKIGSASLGGWDPFGPERVVTKAEANVLYELDGKSALRLYKEYLGDHAKELPGSALLFPLSIRTTESNNLVRTILAVDEEKESLTFAGDIQTGSCVRFMKSNFDRLIDGATMAARNIASVRKDTPELALLISCVGRRLVLKQRVDEEVEGVRNIFGNKTVLTGFYSYGEISPFTPSAKCELHNQTMTITTFSEADEK